MIVMLKNRSRKVFVDSFDGKVYKIGPGKTIPVPIEAVALWIGDPRMEGRELERDRERARYRCGGVLPPLEIVASSEDTSSDEDDKKVEDKK